MFVILFPASTPTAAAPSISVNESLVLFAYLPRTYAHIHLRFIDLHFMFVYIFNKEDVAL